MSAMIRSRMPQKTKFAYTRSPEAVAHQPVPANARIALKASKPATRNMMTAAKVNMPGLRATVTPERCMGSVTPPGIGSLCCAIASLLSVFSLLRLRFVDRLLDFLRLCPYLLLHLLLGPPGRLLNSPLDRRLAHYYQSCVTLIEHLAYILEVRARHAPVQVADKCAGSRPYQPADQNRGREDHADSGPHRQASPATVLGGLLGFVYDLYLAFFVLGYDRGVVGAYEVLAVQLFERLKVGLRVVDALVVACVQKHRVVDHFGLPSPLPATRSAFSPFSPEPDESAPTGLDNPPLLSPALSLVDAMLFSWQEGFHPPMGCFP